MNSLERVDNSPNRRFQIKVFNELDNIENAYSEYKNYIKECKDIFNQQIKDVVVEINKKKIYLKTFKSSRREAIKKAEKTHKLEMTDLKEDFKLEEKGIKELSRLHLLKIETVYNKMVKDYKTELKGNKSALENKLIELNKEYDKYYKQELDNQTSKVFVELNELRNRFETRKADLVEKHEKTLSDVDEKFNISEYKETRRSMRGFKKQKNNEIKQLKLDMKSDLKTKEDIIQSKKNTYLSQRQVSRNNIKNIRTEIKEFYEKLSKEEKAEYRYNQKFVKQHYISRKRKAIDEREKGFLKNINTAYIYIAPALFGVTFFTVLPFIFMIVASFFKLNLTTISLSRFVGFNNFINTFTRDTEFQKALGNTVIYAFVTVILLSIVTISMAAWLSKNTRIHNVAQTMIFTPHIASLVAISILWIAMLNPNGLINQLLSVFGIEGPGWLIQENTSLISVSFVTVWKDIGYYVLIIISGLQSIPAYVYEAAKLDKAKKSTAFFKLTIPLLTPTLSFVFITKFIGSFKVFAPIEIMTNGGPMGSSMVMSYWIYKVGRIGYNYGNAMVGAIVLTILISICTIINFRYFRKTIKY